MSLPSVLLQPRAENEDQDTKLTTIRLTPNATSNFQTRFVIPRQGSVLDSNSHLVWKVSWAGFDRTKLTTKQQLVLAKHYSGCLPSIQRARLYVGGKLIMINEDVAQTVHLSNIAEDPDIREEILDIQLGSETGYYLADQGKFAPGTHGSDVASLTDDRFVRAVGSYSSDPTQDASLEASVRLTDLFEGLKSVRLPIAFLPEVRVELDWNTTFDDVLLKWVSMECVQASIVAGSTYTAGEKDTTGGSGSGAKVTITVDGGGAIQSAILTDGGDGKYRAGDVLVITGGDGAGRVTLRDGDLDSTVIDIKDPVLLLDYLTYDEETNLALGETVRTGQRLPFIHHNISQKVIPANATTGEVTSDIQLALQGKLLYKLYVSQRLTDSIGGTLQEYAKGQGRCRSQRGLDFKYNLFINDLSIHDLPVSSESMAYSFLEMAEQFPVSVKPGDYQRNRVLGTNAANTDIQAAVAEQCGIRNPQVVASTGIRDQFQGTQGYIGFDLAKYDSGDKVVVANAGYRNGSAPAILRVSQKGAADPSPYSKAITIQTIAEEVKMLAIQGGMVEVMDA